VIEEEVKKTPFHS